MKKIFYILALLAFVLPLALTACKPAATPTTAPPPPPTEKPAPTAVPTEKPAPTAVPTMVPTPEPPTLAGILVEDLAGVQVNFWHVWGQGKPAEAMAAIVDDFNKTNEWGIVVNPVDQGRYSDLEDAFNAGIQSGDLPNIMAAYGNVLANWFQVGVVLDLNEFMNDPDVGLTEAELADLYTNTLQYGATPGGAQIGFPISQSANVLFYNFSFAKDLGFDKPPATSAEFKEQACAAQNLNNTDASPDNDGTGGLVLYAGTSNFMSWLYAFGTDGLNATGDGYDFTTDKVVETTLFLKDLQDSGCTFQTESYPNPEFATRKALFTMSSTAGVPYQVAAFTDAGNTDEWGFIPFPGPDGNLATDAFGQLVGVVDSSPEQNLATWLFLRYLTSPEVQARWILGSAYHPTWASTTDYLADYIAANPIWGTGLELAKLGISEPSTPSWTSVRRAVGKGLSAALQAADEAGVRTALADLNQAAADIVAETTQ